jgi:hypothetical protein
LRPETVGQLLSKAPFLKALTGTVAQDSARSPKQ